jgi:putative membrane protein
MLPPMMKLIAKWLLYAAALVLVAHVYPGVEVKSFGSALIAAFVIGLFNVVLRPVLVVLTLPVTLITLGLFLFVINALMFWAAGEVLGGFQVHGFVAALLGSLIYSLLGIVIDSALERLVR